MILWKEGLQLQDVILDTVGTKNSLRTYARGTNSIDTILASTTINI